MYHTTKAIRAAPAVAPTPIPIEAPVLSSDFEGLFAEEDGAVDAGNSDDARV